MVKSMKRFLRLVIATFRNYASLRTCALDTDSCGYDMLNEIYTFQHYR